MLETERVKNQMSIEYNEELCKENQALKQEYNNILTNRDQLLEEKQNLEK